MSSETLSVLLIGNFLSGLGGRKAVCEELAERLGRAGWRVFYASSLASRAARLLDMLLTCWVRRRHYDVAHVDVYSGPAFFWAECSCAALRWAKRPYVLTLHGGDLPTFARRSPMRVRRILNAASAVTVPSQYLMEHMKPYYADQIRIVPNAIEITSCCFRLRSLPNPRMIWLRSFHRIYNPHLAIRVLHTLRNELPDIQLTMIGPDKGDGSLQETQALAVKLGVASNVCFVGAVRKEHVPDWLNRSDILINTTDFDNTPVSVIEALACGLCVVTTNVGGIPYLLDDGHNALLVKANDPDEMAGAVRRILTIPGLAAGLSANGRSLAEQFDWPVVLRQWNELFQSVVRRS